MRSEEKCYLYKLSYLARKFDLPIIEVWFEINVVSN